MTNTDRSSTASPDASKGHAMATRTEYWILRTAAVIGVFGGMIGASLM